VIAAGPIPRGADGGVHWRKVEVSDRITNSMPTPGWGCWWRMPWTSRHERRHPPGGQPRPRSQRVLLAAQPVGVCGDREAGAGADLRGRRLPQPGTLFFDSATEKAGLRTTSCACSRGLVHAQVVGLCGRRPDYSIRQPLRQDWARTSRSTRVDRLRATVLKEPSTSCGPVHRWASNMPSQWLWHVGNRNAFGTGALDDSWPITVAGSARRGAHPRGGATADPRLL